MNRERVKRYASYGAKVLSYLLYAVTIVAAYGGYINPEKMTLPAIAVLVFPYLAIFSLLVAITWLLLKKYAIGCIGIALLLACGPTFTQALPFRVHNTASRPEKTFKMVTFNCLHMKDVRDSKASYSRSMRYLLNSGADFICLQELMSLNLNHLKPVTEAQFDSLKKMYPYFTDEPRKEVRLFSKYPFKKLNYDAEKVKYYGNIGMYRIYLEGDSVTVVNIHLPSFLLSGNERNVLKDLPNYHKTKSTIKELEGPLMAKMKKGFSSRATIAGAIAELTEGLDGPVIVCGDFNDVPGSWAYRQFIKAGLNDAYAETGFGHLITYNLHLMYFHIDQILYKGALMPLYVKKGAVNASDHNPLEAEFEFL